MEPDSPVVPVPTAVITCAVLEDEVRALAQACPAIRRIEILEQGLHNDPPRLRAMLQERIDQVEQDDGIEVIVLGYGLCSRGTEAVVARRCRLVMARAHDCITLLLGCRQRYADYVKEHPGTYWYSLGWNRHHTPPGQDRHDEYFVRYCEKFGPEDARFLMEQEQAWFKSYSRATFVDLGVGPTHEQQQYTRRCADWLNWHYDYQRGDAALMRALLGGPWDDGRFVILEPGQTLRMTADERVVETVPLKVSRQPCSG
jgi:hypothetical protein